MEVYSHVDDLLLCALFEQWQEGSSDSLHTHNVDVEGPCQLICLHTSDLARAVVHNSGIVDQDIEAFTLQIGLDSLNSLLYTCVILNRCGDGNDTVGMFLDKFLEKSRICVAGYGKNLRDLRGWKIQQLLGQLEANASGSACDEVCCHDVVDSY